MAFDPERILFVYKWVADETELGDITCFGDRARVRGSLAMGNELYRWDQAFEHRFSGYCARSPGVADHQTVRVQLQGQTIHYRWDHTREIGRSYFGDRPIIEVECPAGEILLLSYQPTSATENCWCQVIPTLWDVPMPYGFPSRHRERLGQLVCRLLSLLALLVWSGGCLLLLVFQP